MGGNIALLLLWMMGQLGDTPLTNPLSAPLVPELSLSNPFAELPVYCYNNVLLQEGMELPATYVVSAIPFSAILGMFGFLDYTACDASSGVIPYDGGFGGLEPPDDWRFYSA